MVPRMVLYETTFRVLEVPARLSPSAIRSLTGRATEVFPTASTFSPP